LAREGGAAGSLDIGSLQQMLTSLDTSAEDGRIESDLLQMASELTEDEINPALMESVADTHDLGAGLPVEEIDMSSAEMTTVLSAARDHRDEDAGSGDRSGTATSRLTDSLRPDTEVFDRAREVKQELISSGVISGDRELSDGAATDELVKVADSIATRMLDDSDTDPVRDQDLILTRMLGETDAAPDEDEDEYDDIDVAFSAARDVATLRAALEITPDDGEMRWWLAEALREQGELSDAYSEYRWLIRHAPSWHDTVAQALNECVMRDQSSEMAHRLLGDIYRRHGDIGRASAHAAQALQQRKRTGHAR
jgi:hypothetical protein